MKRTGEKFKAIFAALLFGVTIAVSGWVFAEGKSISGTVKDLSNDKGIPGVTVVIKEADTGKLAGKSATDAAGKYSVGIAALGKYTLVASKYGYKYVTALNVIELSDITQNPTVNVSLGRYSWLRLKAEGPTPPLYWDTESGKSYIIPALEIPALILALNGADRLIFPNQMEDGKKVYSSTWKTTRDHVLHGPWTVDTDAFSINQFGHPYQGTLYYGFARSAGLNFWESYLYTNAGSLIWETAGETTRPSINDQIASGTGGSFFGEALFRMSSLVLEGSGDKPGFWRETCAAILCPSMEFNRLANGDRFKPVFPSNNPAIAWRLRLGGSLNSHLKDKGLDTLINKNQVTADYAIAYGLPGKPDYSYDRPFDYFNFEFSTLGKAKNPFDNIMLRGLLLGTDYEAGDNYRGIWGLYGGYDYISPQIFRVAGTSASFGTTYQWWLTRAIALQGSALGGVGYAAAGNVTPDAERDYHFGIAPQGLIALRCIFDDIAMIDLTERAFYITGAGGNDPGGREDINRLNVGLTVHIYHRQAIGIQYIGNIRNARYPDRPDSHQSLGTYALVYTILGDSGFGQVEWRDGVK